jgi:SAM-dependent methyltransferase
MQDLASERAFYAKLFAANPANEHITGGYEEIHALALPEPPRGIVLDLGCGTGAHAVRLARRGCEVIAVDLTQEGVRAARARFTRDGLSGSFVVADAERLPFREQSVAVTWTFLLLHHFPRLDELLREVARVTRDRVIAFEPNAQNGLTWLANNVVNRWWGISAMTPNQRALWPKRLRREFRSVGFAERELQYVARTWSDSLGWVRRLYAAVTAWLPVRFRSNKFLVVYDKASREPAG